MQPSGLAGEVVAGERRRSGHSGGEDGLAARPDVDDEAALELERFRFLLGELREQMLAVVAHELRPDLEAEVDDPLDHRLRRVAAVLEAEADVSRPYERVADPVDRSDEAHHELVRR